LPIEVSKGGCGGWFSTTVKVKQKKLKTHKGEQYESKSKTERRCSQCKSIG
jgi:hypothetical protein